MITTRLLRVFLNMRLGITDNPGLIERTQTFKGYGGGFTRGLLDTDCMAVFVEYDGAGEGRKC